jgi:two-component system LytT family response regulator
MKQKLNALIVDDEQSAIKLLKKLLEETLFFNEIRSAYSADSAIDVLSDFDPDMIFLDIRMPVKDGFDFINDLHYRNGKPGIVFVTAYEKYSIKAIKIQAFDYLLKPVNRKELKQCVTNYIEKSFAHPINTTALKGIETTEKISRIRVNTRTGTAFINPVNILYCKAEGNYTVICTGEKQHLCSLNLGKLQEQLPNKAFIRIGRSLIVNFEYITLLDRKKSSITLVRGNESVTVNISRQHMKDLDTI